MADEIMGIGPTDKQVEKALKAQADIEAELAAAELAQVVVEPELSIKEKAEIALGELYIWHDTDLRFSKRLDAIKAYIVLLEEPTTWPNVPGFDVPIETPADVPDEPKARKGKR